MEINVQVEQPSSTLRKLTIKVPAQEVNKFIERELVETQRTAKIKGFRPGQVPISMVKQLYGDDVRHRVFHSVIDASFQEAVKEHKIQTLGRPKIETPEHKTGEGSHDHSIQDGQDLTYTATVEVLPEIEIKNWEGFSLTREEVNVTDDQVEKFIETIRDSHAQLVPVSGGLVLADGTQSSRPVQKSDFVDIRFTGKLVTEEGLKDYDGLDGTRVLEIGSEAVIPGFEDNLIGMRQGETKTFRTLFPEDFYEKELTGKEAEFTVTVNELKEKKLPELDEDFLKQLGYESAEEFKTRARQEMILSRTEDVDRKLRSELLQKLTEKNPFEVPKVLVESQTRALAQDWAQDLKKQGVDEKTIAEAITRELDSLRKRAEGQVRSSLILESIAKKQGIDISEEEFATELTRVAAAMRVKEPELKDYYAKNPDRKEDMVFRLRQDRTVKFLLDRAKIKSKG